MSNVDNPGLPNQQPKDINSVQQPNTTPRPPLNDDLRAQSVQSLSGGATTGVQVPGVSAAPLNATTQKFNDVTVNANSFPPTNFSFDHIQNPEQRVDAFRNQESLRQQIVESGAQYLAVKDMASKVSLGLDSDNNLTIDHTNPSVGERAKNVGVDEAVKKVIETGAEKIMKGSGDVAGAAIDLGKVLQDVHDRQLLGGTSPEAKEWREKKTISLVAEKLAPKFVQAEKDAHRIAPSEAGAKEYLMNNYYRMQTLIDTQMKNLPPAPNATKHSTVKQGY